MPADTAAEPRLREVVFAIAKYLDVHPDCAGRGALASLRRLRTGLLTEPALQRILWRFVPDRWLDGDGLPQWALLVHAMALAAPDLHRAEGVKGRLGEALFEAQYSEGRLVALLESRAADLPVAVPRAIRFLVAKRVPFSSTDLAYVVFGIFAGGDKAETQRRQIASAYFRAERDARPSRPTNSQLVEDLR